MIACDLPHSAIQITYPNEIGTKASYFENPAQISREFFLEKVHGSLISEISTAHLVISKLADMEANWDGYGAAVISQQTADNGKNAIERLCAFTQIPDITPNPNGTLSFEWETDDGYAHLEIGKTKFSFYIKTELGNKILKDGFVNEIGLPIAHLINEELFPRKVVASSTITKINFPYNDLRHSY